MYLMYLYLMYRMYRMTIECVYRMDPFEWNDWEIDSSQNELDCLEAFPQFGDVIDSKRKYS